jgi:group I intron endonuclease
MPVVYKISNSVNDMIYIGSTIDLKKRWQVHQYSAKKLFNSTLYDAMREIGTDKFQIEILEECEENILIERELFWINHYNSFFPNGYNIHLPKKRSSTQIGPYYTLHIRVSPSELNKFKLLKEGGYSVRKVIELLLADSLNLPPITVYDKRNEEPLLIPRNILNQKGM